MKFLEELLFDARVLPGLSPFWAIALAIAVCIVVHLIANPEKAMLWGALFARAFAWAHHWFRRKYIQSHIVGRLLDFRKQVQGEVSDAMPYGISVEWVRATDPDSFVNDGNVVLRMYDYGDEHKNLVHATLDYVSAALLPRGRVYISPELSRGIDLTMTQKLLKSQRSPAAHRYFAETILAPEFNGDSALRDTCETLSHLDNAGVFTRVLTHELLQLERALLSRTPIEAHQVEGDNFVAFLGAIWTRPDLTALDFHGRFMHVSIVFIAKFEKLIAKGVSGHVNRVYQCFEEGAQRVYICARRVNVPAARWAARHVATKEEYLVGPAKEYVGYLPDGSRMDHVCICVERTDEPAAPAPPEIRDERCSMPITPGWRLEVLAEDRGYRVLSPYPDVEVLLRVVDARDSQPLDPQDLLAQLSHSILPSTLRLGGIPSEIPQASLTSHNATSGARCELVSAEAGDGGHVMLLTSGSAIWIIGLLLAGDRAPTTIMVAAQGMLDNFRLVRRRGTHTEGQS